MKMNARAPKTRKPPTTPPAIPPIAPEERPDDELVGVGVDADPLSVVLDEVEVGEGLDDDVVVVVGVLVEDDDVNVVDGTVVGLF